MHIAALLSGFHALWAVPMSLMSRMGHTASTSDISQFEVHSLPDSPSLSPSWAGRIPVPDVEEGNSLFFWLFDTEDPAHDDDLIIWLNGGPGCSSMLGLTTGNGPVSFAGNTTKLEQNPHSWSKLGHVLYVDQPVGTGFSTASTPYPVRDIDRITSDFHKWLQSFFSEFHHLREKRLHLIGESYAGYYIPYFASAIVANQNSFALDLRSMSIGDGTIGDPAAMSSITIGAFLDSQRSTLQIPDEILLAYAEADKTCRFDTIVQQGNTFPPPPPSKGSIQIPGNPDNLESEGGLDDIVSGTCDSHPTTADAVLASIMNSTCNGSCATFTTAMNYLQTVSDSGAGRDCIDIYDITNDCHSIDPFPLLASYFSRADVQSALNVPPPGASSAPTPYAPCNEQILSTLATASPLPFTPSHSILPELVTAHNISLHVFSGENDLLLNHIGTELVLQNMTWNDARGFSQKPSRLFYADDAAPPPPDSKKGVPAGIWAEERGVSYHLFYGAGHSVFAKKPREMFSFVRDVVVGE